MSFGSDGASIMTRSVEGVSTLLKKGNPFMINIHCMAPRFAQCTSHSANNVENMEKYRQLLTDLYYYFSNSAKHTAGLNAIQEVLQSPQLKMKVMHAVRWFELTMSWKLCTRCRMLLSPILLNTKTMQRQQVFSRS